MNNLYDEEFFRVMAEEKVNKETRLIATNYMKLYDEYKDTQSRDSAFLKDATDAIIPISAILEVYTRDKHIHPSYVVEKLQYSISILESVLDYYKGLIDKPKKDEADE